MALCGDSMTSFQPAVNPSVVQAQSVREPGRAHVLVIGNEKGGSGKSTTALHIAVSLMSDGAKVATIDLDARQGTLTRYLENRAAFIKRKISLANITPTILMTTVTPTEIRIDCAPA